MTVKKANILKIYNQTVFGIVRFLFAGVRIRNAG